MKGLSALIDSPMIKPYHSIKQMTSREQPIAPCKMNHRAQLFVLQRREPLQSSEISREGYYRNDRKCSLQRCLYHTTKGLKMHLHICPFCSCDYGINATQVSSGSSASEESTEPFRDFTASIPDRFCVVHTKGWFFLLWKTVTPQWKLLW